MLLWHEVLPKKYPLIERFNHQYPVRMRQKNIRKSKIKTLEIGAGIGEQLSYENLSDQEYSVLELRHELSEIIKRRFPECRVLVGDCQAHIPFPDQTFDRVLAVHVLEHLTNLPAALKEIYRVCKKEGQFCAVIPCEGGWFYEFCRSISAKRVFEKKYSQSYNWLICSEHVNSFEEVVEEIKKLFKVTHSFYFPFVLPSTHFNLAVGLTMEPTQ